MRIVSVTRQGFLVRNFHNFVITFIILYVQYANCFATALLSL